MIKSIYTQLVFIFSINYFLFYIVYNNIPVLSLSLSLSSYSKGIRKNNKENGVNLSWASSSWQLALHLVILGWRCLSFASLLLSRTESSFPIRRVAVPLYNSLVCIQHILSFREEGKQHERTYLFCLSSSSLMLDATWIVARSARLHAPRATDRVLKTPCSHQGDMNM